MNSRRMLHILGRILLVLAGAELVPLAFALADGEGLGAVAAFGVAAAATTALGLGFVWAGRPTGDLYRRDGVAIVVGAWVLASLLGAIPYLVSGALPHVADALFESVSGFTTTGASVMRDLASVDRSILFWRSFTQWLGGIGIVVVFVALLSELGPGARFLFNLEVPGPKAEILHPTVHQTASVLARIYVALSVAEIVVLLALGLDLFDALTHTFSTVSTGGFSPHGDSVAHFGAAVQWAVTLFMLLAGVNFSLYWALVRRRDPSALRNEELGVYLLLTLGVTAVVGVDVGLHEGSPFEATLRSAAFQVVSIVTTTGFATADFAAWPPLSSTLLVALMFVGGCAGSTAGGSKIVRMLIAWKAALREVRLTFAPNAVIAVVLDGKAAPEASVRGAVSLLLLWFATWGVGTVLLAVGDHSVVTAATASIATLSNIGPGLEAVGPLGHFADFAAWQKLLMVFLMWLGRLEFFALIALLLPSFWRR